MRSPYFCGTPTPTPALKKLGLWTPTPALKNSALRQSDSDSGPKIRLQIRFMGLIVWHTDCVLKYDFREIINSNKRCTFEVAWLAKTVHRPKQRSGLNVQFRSSTCPESTGRTKTRTAIPHPWSPRYKQVILRTCTIRTQHNWKWYNTNNSRVDSCWSPIWLTTRLKSNRLTECFNHSCNVLLRCNQRWWPNGTQPKMPETSFQWERSPRASTSRSYYGILPSYILRLGYFFPQKVKTDCIARPQRLCFSVCVVETRFLMT